MNPALAPGVTAAACVGLGLLFPSLAHADPPLHLSAAPSAAVSTVPPPPEPKRKIVDAPFDVEPKAPAALVTLSLEHADLSELVRTVSDMTGRRFLVEATPKSFDANILAPQRVTVAEAYQAFLTILAHNHLTVVSRGRFFAIVDAADAPHEAPIVGADEAVPAEDRYVTLVHRLAHVPAETVAPVLGKLASHDGTIVPYGELLIITDTGSNVHRMMRVLDEVDVTAGTPDRVWLEPLKFALSGDVKKELDDLLDLKETPEKAEKGAHVGAASGARIRRLVAIDRPNALLVVGSQAGYERLLEILRGIDVDQPATGQMHVVMLEHTEAKKLVAAINEATTAAAPSPQAGGSTGATTARVSVGALEAPVRVSAEETNNALLVTANAHDFAAVREVIRALDQPRRQVFIEAVVMDLSNDRTETWDPSESGFADLSGSMGAGAGAFGGFNPVQAMSLPTDPTALQGMVLGVHGPSIPVPGFLQGVIGTSTIPGIGFFIDASVVSQDSDVLQTPSVMTTDNIPAELHVQLNTSLQRNVASVGLPGAAATSGISSLLGTAPTAAASGYTPFAAPATQNYGKIGPQLLVTPHLNDSDDVRLDIDETLSDLTPDPPQGSLGTINYIEREAKTTLTVKDGHTAVIGGLVRDLVQHAATKVPILGDIPILGALFRSTKDVTSKANLVLVLTPHIIRSEEDMRLVFEKRMAERQEFLDHYALFRDDRDPAPCFALERGQGMLGAIRVSARAIEDERALARETARSSPATHEPQPALDLPTDAPRPVELPRPDAPPATNPLRLVEKVER
jgi:general secretion pathway protein D